MEKPLLNDPDNFPNEDMLADVLKSSYPVYETFIARVTGQPYELVPQWRYYKDGGAWLCKVTFKKKTIFWLSIWDGFFRTTFYFTEKTGAGIADLKVERKLKESFTKSNLIGKLKPLTVRVHHVEEIEDVLLLAEYKKSLR